MTQGELPTPTLRERPPLIEFFEGNPDAIHSKYRPQRRVMCSACVYMLHKSRESWAPLAATWMRKLPPHLIHGTHPDVRQYAFLCQQHHMEWKERDVEKREQRKVNPL